MSNLKVVRTPFEQAIVDASEGKIKVPDVTSRGNKINYFSYQLAVHKFKLSLMSKGMSCKGIKLKDLKHYYGLQSRSAVDCLEEFMVIFNFWTNAD